MEQGMFTAKLRQLQTNYDRLQSQLSRVSSADPTAVKAALASLSAEVAREDALLQRRAQFSRSPLVAELSEAQLAYEKKVQHILTRCRKSAENGDCESSALYAEFAMDFAAQNALYALQSALETMTLPPDE